MRSEKKKKKPEKPAKERLVEKLMLPKDLMLGAAVVTVTGRNEVYVENYRGIVEYTSEHICLQTKSCAVEIEGESLNIVYYTSDEMKINGLVSAIHYM